jgi:DNA mismatch repair protein MSH2
LSVLALIYLKLSIFQIILKLLSDSSNDNNFHIKTHNLNHYLKLDCSAFKALNLLPEQSSSKNQSLYGLLNRCSTNQGQRLLMQWIKQPLIDINKLGL